MLKTNKSIMLNGTSEFNGQPAMVFNANLRSDGNTSLNASIVNQSLYDANKKEAQKDLANFNVKAFALAEETDDDNGSTDTTKTETPVDK